jgi:GNAT superfamily N-acetyltransferase
MEIKAFRTTLKEIEAFRVLFLQENNFEFIYDKCHLYGWADTYLFTIDGIEIGYGSVWGKDKREDRDAIFEFYVLNSWRKLINQVFEQFCAASGSPFIECQSNDLLLSSMLYEYAQNIFAEAILFEEDFQTNFDTTAVVFKLVKAEGYDRQYELKANEETVASGGLMLNYNMPYADIYYGVKENHRRKGYGTLLVQELKKEAYLIGRVPAARCNIKNTISKNALLKAGFKICGYRLNGEIVKRSVNP